MLSEWNPGRKKIALLHKEDIDLIEKSRGRNFVNQFNNMQNNFLGSQIQSASEVAWIIEL